MPVAIWWPEDFSETHNDIDLRVFDPSGTQRDTSTSSGQVREFTQVTGAVAQGTWKVVIDVFSLPRSPQVVYWTAVSECQ
jgi:hypothetical protein